MDIAVARDILSYIMAETTKQSDDGSVRPDPLQEALRRLEEAQRSGASTLDLSNLGLGPVLPSDWPGWEKLGTLDKIRTLKLYKNQINEIPIVGWEALGQLVGLTSLDLQKNQLKSIPVKGWESIGQLVRLSWLDLSNNGMLSLPEAGWAALERLVDLETLALEKNEIGDIPTKGWHTLTRLTKLSNLYLYTNGFAIPEEGWEAVGRLVNLRYLPLISIKTGKISAKGWQSLSQLSKLETLILANNDLGDIPTEGWEGLGRLTNLNLLYISANGLTTIPPKGWESLNGLTKLEQLSLAGNQIGDIQQEGWNTLGQLTSLKRLSLRGNEITTVPAEGWKALSQLGNLEELDLARNRISDIPLHEWEMQGKFPKLQKLDISYNPLPEDLLAAASRGPRSFLEYLEAARLRTAHPRTVKLVLLGEPACGKTTLVEALNGNPKPCDPNRPETIGVNVRRIEKKSPQDQLSLFLATWDFAGRHMEYATHQFFLKPGGIHLILWKARLGSDYGQRDLWYWLELLKMRVKDPEFLLVTTHTGQTPAALDLLGIQALYPGCKGHFEVELCDGTGVVALEKKILELAGGSPSMKSVWPAPWLAVRDAIRGMREQAPTSRLRRFGHFVKSMKLRRRKPNVTSRISWTSWERLFSTPMIRFPGSLS